MPSCEVFVICALLIGLLPACGSSRGDVPATPPAAGSGGAGKADGGVVPDAGPIAAPDGGAGTDAGSADAGSPAGAVGATAELCPGTPAAIDPGPGLGCDAIVPKDLSRSFSFAAGDVNTNANCEADTIDESGNIAVAFGLATNGARFWHLYLPGGADQGRITAYNLFPQGCGFAGTFDVGDYSADFVGSWAPDRRQRTGAGVGGDLVAQSFRASPNGILTLLDHCGYPWTSGAPATYSVGRFDPTSATIAQVNVPGLCGAGAVAVVGDTAGRWLLLVSGDPTGSPFAADDLVGYWLDASGKPLTGWFRIGKAGTKGSYALTALIGGGAAVRVDGVWTYFVPSGEARSQAAPDFLASNPGSDFTLIRSAHAYAVLPRHSGDTSEVKLYSASGSSCGSLSVPGRNLNTGADGSLISSSDARGCTKTVWPRLLR